jgi:K+ transporter
MLPRGALATQRVLRSEAIPPEGLCQRAGGRDIDPTGLTYFVGHETVVSREDGTDLPGWVERMFTCMQRSSLHVTNYFRLPAEMVVEIGREVAI